METSTATTGTPKEEQVLDGSDIMELVENEEVFSSFVDHKFKELDKDSDGQLSVKELKPAVADIGAALGLPAQGSSPDSDHIYSGVCPQPPPHFLSLFSIFSWYSLENSCMLAFFL